PQDVGPPPSEEAQRRHRPSPSSSPPGHSGTPLHGTTHASDPGQKNPDPARQPAPEMQSSRQVSFSPDSASQISSPQTTGGGGSTSQASPTPSPSASA